MSKEMNSLLSRLNSITKKEDRAITQSITNYLSLNNIVPMATDTLTTITTKFGLELTEVCINQIESFTTKKMVNNLIDKVDFTYYVCYCLTLFKDDKKLPISIPMVIGGYPLFRRSILKNLLIKE